MADTPPKRWRCMVCGYVHEGDEPPEYCPVCGAMRDEFEPFEEAAPAKPAVATHWNCLNCNYVHEGARPPAICPICGEDADQFEAVKSKTTGTELGSNARIVVIGAGIAGVSAAEAIRKAAPRSTVTLLGGEPCIPYYRLNLTKYLADTVTSEQLPIHPEQWYSDDEINLQIGVKASAIDRAARQVELSDGSSVPYDKLILAMGAHPFVPPIKGADRDGVVTLRTTSDAEEILHSISSGQKCVVIGGGILGIETAGALGRRGTDVTLLESHDWLMPRQLNRAAAEQLERHISGLGVTVKKNACTEKIAGADRVEAVVLEGGERVPAELVILATGVRANTYLARKAGLDVDKGIVVNNHLQSSDADIYAAGDVAEHNGILYGTWAPAQFQGSIAGMNAVGQSTEFGGLPRTNTVKVLDIDVASFGQFEALDGSYRALQVEGDGKFAHFVLHDGCLVGSILIGYPDLAARVRHAIEQKDDLSAFQHGSHSGGELLNELKK